MQDRTSGFRLLLALALVFISSAAFAQYQLTNLVTNQVGQARLTDPLLVNAWGLARAPGSPWWINDEASGWATLYTAGATKIPLDVEIPPSAQGQIGMPTGIVWSPSQTNEFLVQGWASIFLFATMDGTISGWAPQAAPHDAIIAVDTSSSGSPSSYTALAITNKPAGNILFAADMANNKIDMYNGNFKHVGSFTDKTVPAGFSVFGVRDINGMVFVSFANTAGGSGGFIDIFSEAGKLVTQLTQGGPLNQPWGFAVAPSNFGPLSNTLLISNNTNSGTINGFNAVTGAFVGTIRNTKGDIIHIDQLWSIDFGGGQPVNGAKNELFFTAGPDNNLAGTFASIVAK